MRITLDVLRRYTDLPADPREARVLLDEVGVEVKRIDPDQPGVPMTLELLANRGDHHAYVGIAREVTGRTGGALRLPDVLDLPVGDPPHPLRLDTELCPVYTLTLLERTGEGALPAEALALLASCGLKPVGPVVDATNVANLELGQPTHAFDADTIVGPITIRRAGAGERAWPLFAPEPVVVPEGAVVIADDEKILAIAGVIGCEESKTTDATRRVLLESAGFDPVAVRKASRALGIHTDSSARFERGSDLSLPLVGAGRVARLLADAGWTVRGTSGRVGAWQDPLRTIPFDPEACRRFLDVAEDDATLLGRLARYGFRSAPATDFDPRSGEALRPDGVDVLVPPHRLWDVEYPADLYEEVARSVGYDATPIGLPLVDMGALPTREEQVRDVVAEVLVGHGFYETITDGFHGRALPEQLGFGEGHPLHAHVETSNALDRAYSLLKNEALGQAVEGVALNVRMKHDAVKAFEFTRTFHPDPSAPNGVCTERKVLWAVASGDERPRTWAGGGRPVDPWWLKGVVGEVAQALRLPLEVGPPDPSYPLASALHPNRQAAIRLGGRTVGVLGEVHPGVVARFKLKRVRPCYLELDTDALLAEPVRRPFTEPPRVPPVIRDLAFTLPPRVEAGEVADVLRRSGPSWLLRVDVVDRFDHVEEGVAVSTFTFALTYDNEEEVRTAEALNAATEALVASVHAALGARGVRLRGA